MLIKFATNVRNPMNQYLMMLNNENWTSKNLNRYLFLCLLSEFKSNLQQTDDYNIQLYLTPIMKILLASAMLIIVFCLSAKITCQGPYQCSASFPTIDKNYYEKVYTSDVSNQLEEYITMQLGRQKVNGMVRQLQIMLYLVKATAEAVQNTIRVKMIQSDGTIVQLADKVFTSEIIFIEVQSTFGVAITADNKLYELELLYNGIQTIQYNLATHVKESQSSETIVDLTGWTPIILFKSEKNKKAIVFRKNADPIHHYDVTVDSNTDIFIQFTFQLPTTAVFQVAYDFIMYEATTKKLYSKTTETNLGITYYGNQKLISRSYSSTTHVFAGETAVRFYYLLSVIWNYDQTGTQQVHMHLLSTYSAGDVGLIKTISTSLFTNFANLKVYLSTANQHMVEYDGNHLRYSIVTDGYKQFYTFFTATNDEIQLLIKDSAALQFAFIYTRMIIFTNEKMIEVDLLPGYNTNLEQTPDPLEPQWSYYYIRENLILNQFIGVSKTLDLGSKVTNWISFRSSEFILTRIKCSCVDEIQPNVKCFSNIVCLLIQTYGNVDCTAEIVNTYVSPT